MLAVCSLGRSDEPRVRSAGNAAYFDGVDDVIQVVSSCSSADGFLLEEATYMAWVNVESDSTYDDTEL